jgi:branched-chain amino acid transport system substrate-binding protein
MFLLFIAIVCLLALAGCAPLRGTRPLVKIGLAAPFEGFGRPMGYEALAGVKLALAERNAAGGVGGYMVELVALNDFGEPDEARLQAKEFAADPHVVGVIAGWDEATARAALPAYRQAGLAVVVPWSVSAGLADPRAGIVLVAADRDRAADFLAEAVMETDPRRVVVVGEEGAAAPFADSLNSSRLMSQTVAAPGSLGGQALDDWAAYLTLSRVRPPDGLILVTESGLAGEALLALSARGWNGAAYAGPETASVQLVNVAGEAANGMLYISPGPAGEDVGSNYSELSPRGVLAYDATHVLLDAIELAIQQEGKPTRQAVADALPTVRRDGLSGPISFDSEGRRVNAPLWLYNILNAEYPGQILRAESSN